MNYETESRPTLHPPPKKRLEHCAGVYILLPRPRPRPHFALRTCAQSAQALNRNGLQFAFTKPLLYRGFSHCTAKPNFFFEPIPHRRPFRRVYISPPPSAQFAGQHFAFCNLNSAFRKPLLYRGFFVCTAKPIFFRIPFSDFPYLDASPRRHVACRENVDFSHASNCNDRLRPHSSFKHTIDRSLSLAVRCPPFRVSGLPRHRPSPPCPLCLCGEPTAPTAAQNNSMHSPPWSPAYRRHRQRSR